MKTWMGIVPSVFLYVLLHSLGSFSYALFDSLYGMPNPSVERSSTSFWLLHWSPYCDMPSIRRVSTVVRKLGAPTDLSIYNAWRSDMSVCMICRDMNDADRCWACMRATVLAVCTPFSIHNVTLWSSCGAIQLIQHHLAILWKPTVHSMPCADCHCLLPVLLLHVVPPLSVLAWLYSYVLALWTVR